MPTFHETGDNTQRPSTVRRLQALAITELAVELDVEKVSNSDWSTCTSSGQLKLSYP